MVFLRLVLNAVYIQQQTTEHHQGFCLYCMFPARHDIVEGSAEVYATGTVLDDIMGCAELHCI